MRCINDCVYTFFQIDAFALHPTSNVPASNLQTGARVALLGLAINIVLATAKIVTGVLGNAYVLIADGIESALDVGGSIVIWGGIEICGPPAGRDASLRPRKSRTDCGNRRCGRRVARRRSVSPFKACAKFSYRITRRRRSR